MSALPATALSSTSLALARRFHAGATLWCLSPDWPHHAEHVAVEFVHPVIVGKRALPADVVRGPDAVAALRALSAPGDVLLGLGGPGGTIDAAMRRAPAWGMESVWFGAGPSPPVDACDHLLWLDDQTAPHTGELVLLYHMLWELTHVCFEHPGLLDLPAACAEEVCITCSDDAALGDVVRVGPDHTALVRTAGGTVTVDTSVVGPLAGGELVLVHAGIAIDVVPELVGR